MPDATGLDTRRGASTMTPAEAIAALGVVGPRATIAREIVEQVKEEHGDMLRHAADLRKAGFDQDDIVEVVAAGVELSKGKKAEIGETRTWSGEQYTKMGDGSWEKKPAAKRKGMDHDKRAEAARSAPKPAAPKPAAPKPSPKPTEEGPISGAHPPAGAKSPKPAAPADPGKAPQGAGPKPGQGDTTRPGHDVIERYNRIRADAHAKGVQVKGQLKGYHTHVHLDRLEGQVAAAHAAKQLSPTAPPKTPAAATGNAPAAAATAGQGTSGKPDSPHQIGNGKTHTVTMKHRARTGEDVHTEVHVDAASDEEAESKAHDHMPGSDTDHHTVEVRKFGAARGTGGVPKDSQVTGPAGKGADDAPHEDPVKRDADGRPAGHNPPTAPHEVHRLQVQVDKLTSQLKAAEAHAGKAHEKAMLAQFHRESAQVRKDPSPEGLDWLSKRISAFLHILTGATLGAAGGAMVAGPAGALAGGVAGAKVGQAVHARSQVSKALVMDVKTGRLMMKAESHPYDEHAPMPEPPVHGANQSQGLHHAHMAAWHREQAKNIESAGGLAYRKGHDKPAAFYAQAAAHTEAAKDHEAAARVHNTPPHSSDDKVSRAELHATVTANANAGTKAARPRSPDEIHVAMAAAHHAVAGKAPRGFEDEDDKAHRAAGDAHIAALHQGTPEASDAAHAASYGTSPVAGGTKTSSPPGSGWQAVPGGRHGGYRKANGPGTWMYWYPNRHAAAGAAQHHAELAKEHNEAAPESRQAAVAGTPKKKPGKTGNAASDGAGWSSHQSGQVDHHAEAAMHEDAAAGAKRVAHRMALEVHGQGDMFGSGTSPSGGGGAAAPPKAPPKAPDAPQGPGKAAEPGDEKKVEATGTNIGAMAKHLRESSDGMIRRVSSTSVSHVKRTIAAGLLEQHPTDKAAWRVTAAGAAAVAGHSSSKGLPNGGLPEAATAHLKPAGPAKVDPPKVEPPKAPEKPGTKTPPPAAEVKPPEKFPLDEKMQREIGLPSDDQLKATHGAVNDHALHAVKLGESEKLLRQKIYDNITHHGLAGARAMVDEVRKVKPKIKHPEIPETVTKTTEVSDHFERAVKHMEKHLGKEKAAEWQDAHAGPKSPGMVANKPLTAAREAVIDAQRQHQGFKGGAAHAVFRADPNAALRPVKSPTEINGYDGAAPTVHALRKRGFTAATQSTGSGKPQVVSNAPEHAPTDRWAMEDGINHGSQGATGGDTANHAEHGKVNPPGHIGSDTHDPFGGTAPVDMRPTGERRADPDAGKWPSKEAAQKAAEYHRGRQKVHQDQAAYYQSSMHLKGSAHGHAAAATEHDRMADAAETFARKAPATPPKAPEVPPEPPKGEKPPKAAGGEKTPGLRAKHDANEHGHRDGLVPGQKLPLRDRHVLEHGGEHADAEVLPGGKFKWKGKEYDGGHALMAAIHGKGDHQTTVRRYFKLGGEKSIEKALGELRHLLQPRGVTVVLGSDNTAVLSGDLRKAGVPLHLWESQAGQRATLGPAAAEGLAGLIKGGQ